MKQYLSSRPSNEYHILIREVREALDALNVPTGDVQGEYTPAYRIKLLGKMTEGYKKTIEALIKRRDDEC